MGTQHGEGDAHGQQHRQVGGDRQGGFRLRFGSAKASELPSEGRRHGFRSEGRLEVRDSEGGLKGEVERSGFAEAGFEVAGEGQASRQVGAHAASEVRLHRLHRLDDETPHANRAAERRDCAGGARRHPRHRCAGSDSAAVHRAAAVRCAAAGRARRDAEERG
ncbi:hypothetical protein ACFPRL_28985 [Pseudoclavibacter helvolus]